MSYLLCQGDARRIPLPDGSVHCVATSPPFFGLRDYQTGRWVGGDPACSHKNANARPDHSNGVMLGTRGGRESSASKATPMKGVCGKCGARRVDRQIGLEKTPRDYIESLLEVFADVKRVMRDDATLWVNIGDTYSGYHENSCVPDDQAPSNKPGYIENMRSSTVGVGGLKPKCLAGIPWMLAFALRDELGLYLRDAIVWSKAEVDDSDNLEGSCMPGSQRDRCTFAYEMVFLLTKSPRYFFDLDAARTKSGAAPRNVWRVNPEPLRLPHFAAWPSKLVERMIRLGTSEKGACPSCGSPWVRVVERESVPRRVNPIGYSWSQHRGSDDDAHERRPNGRDVAMFKARHPDLDIGWRPSCGCPPRDPSPCTVLDCFSGAGTTLIVAEALGRRGIGIDLSQEYLALARRRITRPHSRPAKAERSDEVHPLFDAAGDHP